MNKNHRVVWSEARNCFVVAGENAKSNGRPSTTRKAIAAAVTALFLAPGVASAAPSCSDPATISTALSTPVCYTDVNVTVESTGSVSVNSHNTAVSVYSGSYSSTFENKGTISSTYSTSGYRNPLGLYINSIGATGKLINSGTIRATLTADGGEGMGVFTYSAAGQITNSGTISAVVNGVNSAVADGLMTYNDLSGTLTNSGTISATASGPANNNATAYGVRVNGSLSGSLSNSGTISATAKSASYAYAYGVYVNGTMSGTLNNSGTISATANASASGSDAYARGIYVNSSLTGSIINSGSINVTARSLNSDAYSVMGVYIGGDVAAQGSITNSGTISVSATGYSYANVWGININGSLLGSLTNSGSITATALSTNGYEATAYGIQVNNALSGSLINSGTITASATIPNDSAYAYGIYVGGNLSGTLTNSGTISATAVGVDSANQAYAYGVYISSSINGDFNNTGTISATADGPAGGAYGVYVSGTLDGTINNSGTIRAAGMGGVTSNIYSIYVDGGGKGTINNLAGGLLDGRLYAGGSINVNNAGTMNIGQAMSYVGGDYSQSATGVLTIGATQAGANGGKGSNFGNLDVGGNVTLASGATIRVNAASNHTLAAADVMGSVITSGGTLTMTTVKVQDNILGLNFVASQNGNNVDLTAVASGLTSVSGALGGSGGASGAASLLDSLLSNPDGQSSKEITDLLYAIGGAGSSKEVADGVAQILPLLSGGNTQASLGAMHGVNRVVQARQEGNQGRASGDTIYSNRGMWFKPFGSWADQRTREGISGYDATTYGLVVGADADISSDRRVGVAASYAYTDVDGKSSAAPQGSKVNSYQLVGYGTDRLSADTELSYQADLGYHTNKGHRNITALGLVAKSSYDAYSAHIGAGFAKTLKLSDTASFTPSVRADYTAIWNDGYTEKGAGGLNLVVKDNSADELILSVDGKYSKTLSDVSTFTANAGLGYDVLSKRSSITSSLAGAPGATFSTQGIDPSAWLVRGGLGIVRKTSDTVEVTARYDVEARRGFDNQTASVKVRMAF